MRRIRAGKRVPLRRWIDPREVSAMAHLNARERQFVENLAGGMTHEAAHKAAGYKDTNHVGIFKRPLIQAALYQRMNELMRATEVSHEVWFRKLAYIAFLPPELLSRPYSPAEQIQALELMARVMKWLTGNAAVNVQIGVTSLFGAATRAVMDKQLAAERPGPPALLAAADSMVRDVSRAAVQPD